MMRFFFMLPGGDRAVEEKTLEPIDWDNQPLGKMPDAHLARMLSVQQSTVSEQRRKRGIAPFVVGTTLRVKKPSPLGHREPGEGKHQLGPGAAEGEELQDGGQADAIGAAARCQDEQTSCGTEEPPIIHPGGG